jgi:hypothetical protein
MRSSKNSRQYYRTKYSVIVYSSVFIVYMALLILCAMAGKPTEWTIYTTISAIMFCGFGITVLISEFILNVIVGIIEKRSPNVIHQEKRYFI